MDLPERRLCAQCRRRHDDARQRQLACRRLRRRRDDGALGHDQHQRQPHQQRQLHDQERWRPDAGIDGRQHRRAYGRHRARDDRAKRQLPGDGIGHRRRRRRHAARQWCRTAQVRRADDGQRRCAARHLRRHHARRHLVQRQVRQAVVARQVQQQTAAAYGRCVVHFGDTVPGPVNPSDTSASVLDLTPEGTFGVSASDRRLGRLGFLVDG